jgi:nucleoid DNA-binding protein
VKLNKETTPVLDYVQPNLSSFKPFLAPEEFDEIVNLSKVDIRSKIRAIVSLAGTVDVGKRREELLEYARRTDSDTPTVHDGEDTEPLIELRKVFIELLSRSYEEQFENGEIDVRNVSLIIALKTSIAVMKDEVAQGAPIGDWFIIAQLTMAGSTKNWLSNVDKLIHKKKNVDSEDIENAVPEQTNELELEEVKSLVYRAFGFIEAHKRAQREFTNEFCTGKLLTEDELKVLDESIAQVQAAEAALKAFGQATVERMLAHLLCTIILSKAADFVGNLTKKGMLSDQEAEHFLEEIEEDMNHVGQCQSAYEKMQKEEDADVFNQG